MGQHPLPQLGLRPNPPGPIHHWRRTLNIVLKRSLIAVKKFYWKGPPRCHAAPQEARKHITEIIAIIQVDHVFYTSGVLITNFTHKFEMLINFKLKKYSVGKVCVVQVPSPGSRTEGQQPLQTPGGRLLLVDIQATWGSSWPGRTGEWDSRHASTSVLRTASPQSSSTSRQLGHRLTATVSQFDENSDYV